MADTVNGDRVFCHACGCVWLRSEHGLTCPDCDSDFSEIIEEPAGTRNSLFDEPDTHEYGQRPDSAGSLFGNHHPWRDMPDENDDENNQDLGQGGFTQTNFRSRDGRFSFTSRTYRGSSGTSPRQRLPHDHPPDPLLPLLNNFETIFHGIANTYTHQGSRMGQRTAGPSPFGAPPQTGPAESNPTGNGGRNTFTATGRLWPRDANNAQPDAQPLGGMDDLLNLFRQDYHGPGRAPGAAGDGMMAGPNPLAIIAQILSGGRNGDVVYSQEELDRVISELIDQNMNGTAPGPASEAQIQALPKKKTDQEMVGTEGKAECSICMDPVGLDVEVTVLPCKHWFHPPCISAWLNEHDTCPHCRASTAQPTEGGEGSRTNPVNISDSPERSSTAPRPAFGTHPNNYPGQRNSGGEGSSTRSQPSNRSDGGGGGGGITGWVRRLGGGGS
ncbi:hypothetical protein FQN54_004087 [Arachnomyces sp. PD_36]|nr:hypothetical protein FQN54_004087 [Arachnomyces sp. PD_36]